MADNVGSIKATTQMQIVSQPTVKPGQALEPIALFDGSGNPVSLTGLAAATTSTAGIVKKAAANADVATANAGDLATAIALANQLKISFNALQAVLRTAGILT